ncbi:DIS3 [Bugula neritina]|uniref:DIS3 n=1 Tax=Bugula neritina TaxID=10212 RepID=A0A7J7JA08_BUGNE|nr:DIS3 [Bugula neritina]
MLKSKVFVKKTKRGGILKIVREHYLRDDILCGFESCELCYKRKGAEDPMEICSGDHESRDIRPSSQQTNICLSDQLFVTFDGKQETHVLIPDTNVVLHQVDVLEDDSVKNVIILATVVEEVRHQSLTIYKRLRDLIANPEKHFYVFINEHHNETYVERVRGETANDRNDRAIRVASHWYSSHLAKHTNVKVVLLTNDRENLKRALMNTKSKLSVYTVQKLTAAAQGT